MFAIGKFSRLCKMSARMLRYYDKEGLLKPEHTDEINGYRYYGNDQLERALLIKKLKEYKFSLLEIKTILHTSEQKLVTRLLCLKIKELSKEINQNRNSISEIQNIIEKKGGLIKGEQKGHDILLGIREERKVISQRMQININYMYKYIDILYDNAEKMVYNYVVCPQLFFWMKNFCLVIVILN